MTLVKRGVFVTHGGGYTMNSNAKADDLPDEVRALLSTEEGRAKLRAALDKIEEPEEEVAANALRMPGLLSRKRAAAHVNNCDCQPCREARQVRDERSHRANRDADAPLVPRGLL